MRAYFFETRTTNYGDYVVMGRDGNRARRTLASKLGISLARAKEEFDLRKTTLVQTLSIIHG